MKKGNHTTRPTRNCNRCKSCEYYKKHMCVADKPNVENRPFGFPFKYHPNKITCHSWQQETMDKWATWEHM